MLVNAQGKHLHIAQCDSRKEAENGRKWQKFLCHSVRNRYSTTSHADILRCVSAAAHPVLLPPVRREVVHGDFDALALLELAQGVGQQVEVEGVRVVKVVVVAGSANLLLRRQNLRMRPEVRSSVGETVGSHLA